MRSWGGRCWDGFGSIETTRPWPSRSQIEARKKARPPFPVPVSRIQSGRTFDSSSWYAIRSVGSLWTDSPSQVPCFQVPLCQTASIIVERSSSGSGTSRSGRPSGSVPTISLNRSVVMRRGFVRSDALFIDPT